MLTLPIIVFDFFSGCGGTCEGFKNANMVITSAIDNDHDSQETFTLNFPNATIHTCNIKELDVIDLGSSIIKSSGHPILFSVSAPCQPFTNQNTTKPKLDHRVNLLDEFIRFAEFFLPDYIFLENVPGIQKVSEEEGPFQNLLAVLNANEYRFKYKTIRALEYGVPQTRKRLVLIASKHADIDFPPRTNGPGTDNEQYSTVADWIVNLPPLEAGTEDPNIPNHICAALSHTNLERMIHTPINGGGRNDWPDELRLQCHSNGYNGHTDVYGRMSWDRPASCLTTRCTSISNGRFGHPEQNRAISAREAACLQTFSRDFEFFGGITSISRQIGNAVPPLLAQRFGEMFNTHFLEYNEG